MPENNKVIIGGTFLAIISFLFITAVHAAAEDYTGLRIAAITIVGNKRATKEAILSYLPFKIGESFDPQKTGFALRNLYEQIALFRDIKIFAKKDNDDAVIITLKIDEKLPLKEILIKGNKQITEKELFKKIKTLETLRAIEEPELYPIAEQIKALYREKGYDNVVIKASLVIDDRDNSATAEIVIEEGERSRIKRISFEGNQTISSKELQKVLFSRPEWLMSFLDRSGVYHKERIEADKHAIEMLYQNSGYPMAKVLDVQVDHQESDPYGLLLTYQIEEGAPYTFGSVKVESSDPEVSQEVLLSLIPCRPGEPYSRDRIAQAIKNLEHFWADQGYIFAHIDPSIQQDEDARQVNISFYCEIGNKIYLNRLDIKGNKKTRDKIIRRRLFLQEGSLLSQSAMDASKSSVEQLGYFDQRDGVNWKIRRIDEEHADAELVVKEGKTGHVNAQIGFGGAGLDIKSPVSGLTFKGQVSDTNLFGRGINWNLEGSWAKEEQTIQFHLAQPWLFDRPITGALDFYHKRPTYDNFSHLENNGVNQKLTGGTGTLGFITRSTISWFNDISILTTLGIDSIHYQECPKARRQEGFEQFQCILNREFSPGDFIWLAASFEQDRRNHPTFTNRGYRWKFITKAACKALDGNISFFKTLLEAFWFTPIINEYDLIFKLHGFFGFVTPIRGSDVPYGELFHVGGDASVRGFLWGQIEPRFNGDPIGAKKAFWVNAELGFPITPDMSMRGVLFYDGGVGWDNPYVDRCVTNKNLVTNNGFDYRHAVGFGVRLTNPMPIRVDWGFKIDPRKGESPYELHFGMTYDW